MDIKQQIETLRDELRQHNYNYYVLDTPTVTDYEFDLKLKLLQELETKNPKAIARVISSAENFPEVAKETLAIIHDKNKTCKTSSIPARWN